MTPIQKAATRADRIQEAVKNEIRRMAGLIDSMPGLRGVSFTVKVKPDGTVRAVIFGTESSTDPDNGAV